MRVAGTPENDFFPTIEAWRDAITENTVAIIINTPCNPTGTVAERDYLQALVNLATAHDLYIISDEVYDHLLYGREHVSVASLDGAKERTLLLNSFSKTYAMTGWRIGYLCAPEAIITSALKAGQHSVTNIAEFTQRAAIVALTDPAVQVQITSMVEAYAARRELVKAVYADFGDTPIKLNDPQGAFYFFIDVRELEMPSTMIAERLLQEAHVALVPGSVYGDAGEGFLRMTTAASDDEVKAGITGLLQWVESVPV
ncbi:MAG: aminotransferase class I/II-fold pyridoxal phosphate-dependent enzyme [Chloroflexota bacterium]